MTLTVRLDPDIERAFEAACRLRRTTKSAVVTQLIRSYIQAEAPAKSPYELAEEMGLVGCLENAPAPGRDHSRYLKAKLRGKIGGATNERRSG
jgi:hypothetical protein